MEGWRDRVNVTRSLSLHPSFPLSQMLWGSRFDKPLDDVFARFNNSFRFDWRMYDADVRGSIAYAKALARVGILTEQEAGELERGLKLVRDEFASGTFAAQPN